MGWRGRQFKCAEGRFSQDLLMALALIHHLIFTEGLDFPRAIDTLLGFPHNHLLIEFVSIDDPMAVMINRRVGMDYEWYTLDVFLETLAEKYTDIKVLKSLSATRTLVLASKPIL
jgi:hypothetical protein